MLGACNLKTCIRVICVEINNQSINQSIWYSNSIPTHKMATDSSAVVLIVLLLFSSNAVDSNILDCFTEGFNSTVRWNVSIHEQEELDKFIENVTSYPDDNTNRCIQLFLTGKSYGLDVIKMTEIKLGRGGGLVVVGVANPPWPRVKINCVTTVSDLEELRGIFRPISNISLISLKGLTFTACPVPLVLEEVSNVMVQNCDFM